MLWKGKFNLIFLFLVLISCKNEKKYKDYKETDFYEVQGTVTNNYETSSPFDSPYNKLIDYCYILKDSTILFGKENEFYLDLNLGQPVVILVHKKDPKISFYGRTGLLDGLTKYQANSFDSILRIKKK